MAMEVKIEEIENYESEISTAEICIVEKIENPSNNEVQVHTSSDISNSPNTALPKTFQCPMFDICSESFPSVDLLNEHYISNHSTRIERTPRKKIVRQNCASDTLFVSNSSEYQNLQNDANPNSLKKKPKFSCRDCSYVAKDRKDSVNHRNRVHRTEKRFKCTECDYATRQAGNLSHHMSRVHHTIQYCVGRLTNCVGY